MPPVREPEEETRSEIGTKNGHLPHAQPNPIWLTGYAKHWPSRSQYRSCLPVQAQFKTLPACQPTRPTCLSLCRCWLATNVRQGSKVNFPTRASRHLKLASTWPNCDRATPWSCLNYCASFEDSFLPTRSLNPFCSVHPQSNQRYSRAKSSNPSRRGGGTRKH
ncbi:hypothetical protein LIA77_01580 [Sarocladium implicatum]|nr:hypothetical protein LIA77_01580 [Sarocladium implicatum]